MNPILMQMQRRTAASLSFFFLFAACGDHTPTDANGSTTENDTEAEAEPPHIDLPPVVVSNLGLTFQTVRMGRVDTWREVPGELRVPEQRRYPLQSPAHAHVLWLSDPWSRVSKGDPVVRLHSPELNSAQSEMIGAEMELARTRFEIEAARARLTEADALVDETRAYRDEAVARADELSSLVSSGGSLTRREAFESTRLANEARRALLDAEVRRDGLRSALSKSEQHHAQAEIEIERVLHRMGILTGLEPEELLVGIDDGPRWKSLEELTIRAPADGVVIGLATAAGLPVDHGDLLVTVIDPREFHFHGVLPETLIDTVPNGAHCELRLAGRSEPFEARLFDAPPVADAASRSIRIDAIVPNSDGLLADGLSATLAIRIAESSEEKLVISEDSIVQDGLVSIVFRRFSIEDQEYRPVPLTLGRRGGGKVEILDGLEDGDWIVSGGARQVLRAFKDTGGGSGGHMHADGTWHDDH